MNKKKQKPALSRVEGVVPALRFPEFENDGEWKKSILSNVSILLKGKGISKSDIVKNGSLPCIRYGELYTLYNEVIDTIVSKTDIPKEKLVLSQKNDVIIPSSGETREDIATASCVLKEGVALGGDLNIIRSSINGVFLSYYLSHSKRRDISKLAQGVAVIHLYISQLEQLEINFPAQKEQQKIANCLSSLDHLISAENEKLDQLKDLKKGLLQQLFPAESDTSTGSAVPKLRFPEFENDGEWELKSINEIGNIVASGDLDKDLFSPKQTRDHTIPIYSNSVSNEGLYGYSSYSKHNPISVTITARGTLGVAFVRKTEFVGIGRLLVVSDFKKNDPFFFKENWNYYAKLPLENGGIPQLTAVKAKKVKLFYPKNPKEQQKIANCLSSIDDSISAQEERLEALKNHKKGLMQQLFPKLNDFEL